MSMSDDQKAWLERQLGAHIPIKAFIKTILMERYLTDQGQPNAA